MPIEIQGAYVSFKRWKAPIKSRKTHKLRKIDDLAEKYAELDKESPKAVKDKLKKDMMDLQNDVVNIISSSNLSFPQVPLLVRGE